VKGEHKPPTACYGISERSIAALISLHGDDKGLVLPPDVAPVQIVIIPIPVGKRKEEVADAAKRLKEALISSGFRVRLDDRDLRPGAKYYYWEMRGVPLRLEIGPRDIDAGQVTAVTRTNDRSVIPIGDLTDGIELVLSCFRSGLLARAEAHLSTHLTCVHTMAELEGVLAEGVAVVSWCGDRSCAEAIRQDERIASPDECAVPILTGEECGCIVCGKPGVASLVGRAY
jgi:prolyl-tRNA synthetase